MADKEKLSPGELAFMASALDEAGGKITAGTMINYDHTEGRAVGGLEKKGLVCRHKGEVEVTAIGENWLFDAAAERAIEAKRIIEFARENIPGGH